MNSNGSSEVVIRRPHMRDLERIVEIEKKSFDDPFPKEVLFVQLFLHSDLSFVAEVNGKVVGYAICAPREDGYLHLLNFAVDPEYRGKGIGTKLLLSVIEEAKFLGFKGVRLEVNVNNERARRLYEKHGFRVVEVLENYYRNGVHAYLMIKELRGNDISSG